jgi:hypothetical protein
MTPLLWFLLGGCVFSLIAIVAMARVAKKEDEWDDWARSWRNPVLTDEDYEFIRAAERNAALRRREGVGWGANPERTVWMRRGPYDWREEGL